MARRSDPDARPKRRRGVLRHYRRPIWKDRLFWLIGAASVLVTALFVAVILVITGRPETPLGWARPTLLGLVVLLLSFRLLGAGVTTSRHFQRGLGEGSAPRPNDLEAKGRAAGAVVGRAVKAARNPKTAPQAAPATTRAASPATTPVAEPEPAPAPAPASAAEDPAPAPKPKVSTDAAARSIGSMVGRRMAERRKKT